MPAKAKKIPEGFHTLTPHLMIREAAKAIEFYKKAFGAKEVYRMPGPEGSESVLHAELLIGSSKLLLADDCPEMGRKSPTALGGSPVMIHIYVEDADSFFKKAVEAGATVTMPLENMFWGDRYGTLQDPFGHHWGVGTHLEDVSPAEMQKRAAALFEKMPK